MMQGQRIVIVKCITGIMDMEGNDQMRLDKLLCEMNIGARSQVKDFIRCGLVTVNGCVADRPEYKVDEQKDRITFRGEVLLYRKFVYYMLNKPAGVVSATRDNLSQTVLELLTGVKEKDLFPVGRLDKDTEGLLLITNDGGLAHRLLSPGKHVDKVYLAGIRAALSEEDIGRLEQGVDIGEEKLSLPAHVEVVDEKTILLTIQEGKFHQVKRMLQAVNNEVVTLKRVAFGPLRLDEGLKPGGYRELTQEELRQLPVTMP